MFMGVHPLNDPVNVSRKDPLSYEEEDELVEDVGKRSRAPRCECQTCIDLDPTGTTYIATTFSDYDSINPRTPGGLSDHQYMLCMSHMFGFILKDRVYGKLVRSQHHSGSLPTPNHRPP